MAQAWNQSPPLPLQSSTADCQSRGKPRAAGGGKKTSRGNGQKEKKERERKEREEEKEEMERKEREEEKEEKERKRRSASETTGQRRRTLTSERKEGLESRQMTPLTPDLANISIRSGVFVAIHEAGTPLIQTPTGQKKVSILVRYPHFRS